MPSSNRRVQSRRRGKVGGSGKQIVSFTFSAELVAGKGPAKAENYPEMILAWYKDTSTWSSEELEDISISYNPSTKLYEGTCLVDGTFSREDIDIAIKMLVDPDDDGNYPILIKDGAANAPAYVDGSYNSIGNGNHNNNNNYNGSNNYENRTDIYLVAGTVNSIQVSNVGPTRISVRAIPRNNENALTMEPIADGNGMVNFHDESARGRYYKKSSYNSMVQKINPFTRKAINAKNVVQYKAKVGGAAKGSRRHRRRQYRKTRRARM
jgi:hypothetical protein